MSDWNDVLIALNDGFSALEKELRRISAEMSAIIREYVDGQKDEPKTQMKTQNSNLNFEKRTMRDCYNCKRYETEGECIECNYEPKDDPQTHCPIAIIFSCDECPHPTNCKYKTDCKRCRHFATDNCHECYGNELFEESGYITELTNTSQTEREVE